jgi:hypothetical protein
MPPKAEVNSEHARQRHRPLRVDGAARDVIQAPKPEPRIMRYELSDYEWTAIKPMLPNKPRGVRRANDRRVLNGVRVPPSPHLDAVVPDLVPAIEVHLIYSVM